MSDWKTRDVAITRLIEGAGNILSPEVLSRSLYEDGWIVHPVFFQDMIVGAIIEKGGEIHTSIAPEYQKKWNPRPYVRTILHPALKKYGQIYSDAAKDDSRAKRWLVRLGFVKTGEDQERIYYTLTEESLRI